MATPFQYIYDRFFGRITDDQYLEWTKEDTEADVEKILIDAIPGFEFPRFSLYDYGPNEETTDSQMQFNSDLTSEEINILAHLMYNTWLQRQIASVEQTRMKYSGSDFKMTSQANHLAKLMDLKKEAERQDRHMQRLYKRRKQDKSGNTESNWSILIQKSALDDDEY